jgi:hypothetical protein
MGIHGLSCIVVQLEAGLGTEICILETGFYGYVHVSSNTDQDINQYCYTGSESDYGHNIKTGLIL